MSKLAITGKHMTVYTGPISIYMRLSHIYSVPGLQDTLGKPIHFETYQFEIIESDITDINLHKVAIIYFTSSLTLFDNFGNHLILATGDQTANNSKDGCETFLLKLLPHISIVNYSEVKIIDQRIYN